MPASSDISWPFGLPEEDGYGEKPEPVVNSSEFISGRIKHRKISSLTRTSASVVFVFSHNQYLAFITFYNSTTKSGTLPFQMELLSGIYDVTVQPDSVNYKIESSYVKVSFKVEYYS